MNENARKYFEENPEEKYWYYSPTLRVPNPKRKPWLREVPWPKKEGEGDGTDTTGISSAE